MKCSFTRANIAAIFLAWATASSSASGQSIVLDHDYDLVNQNGLVAYSQTDSLWARLAIGPLHNHAMSDCGCLLAALATIYNQQLRGTFPWFAVPLDYGRAGFDYNPIYLDTYFNYGPNGVPTAGYTSYPEGWGYKQGLPFDTCGVIPIGPALGSVGEFLGQPTGLTAVGHDGFGADVLDIVNRNLIAGRPTIVAIVDGPLEAGENVLDKKSNHAVLIAGWDADYQQYRILDPRNPSVRNDGVRVAPAVPVATDPGEEGSANATYEKWLARVKGIIDMQGGGLANAPYLAFGDDPSPVEILMTAPDGRRTGYDPETSASYEENAGASYWTAGPWRDPLGQVRVGESPRFVIYPGAPSGRYSLKVTGTADGPLKLEAQKLWGGTRESIAAFTGSIAAGEVRKYEVDFSLTGASSAAEVADFAPVAEAGPDVAGRTDTPIGFEGIRSFDADGELIAYDWNFGDGRTGSGVQTSHVYTVPGDYTVTLTVTDAAGGTATDATTARVILSQRRPVADLSGPYLGFVSTNARFRVVLDGRGSSDPNGDPLTYRWDFGDGSPAVTTSQPIFDHEYAAIGTYTPTLVVNDGIDDSLPVTTTVEIEEPPSWPLNVVDLAMSPACGSPGDYLTLNMATFARFGEYWNYGYGVAMPTYPPSYLPLGVSAPNGTFRYAIAAGEREFAPFTTTQLSPGRYTASVRIPVPDLPPGNYPLYFGEEGQTEFQVPCPLPANAPPIADAGGPYAGGTGNSIRFDGTGSFDPEGAALTYEWNFGDLETGTGPTPEHTYLEEGEYFVSLLVSDGELTSLGRSDASAYARVVVSAGSADTTPPVTTAVIESPPPPSGWHNTDVTVLLMAEDEPGGSGVRDIEVALSGAETSDLLIPGDNVAINIVTDGVTELTYRATDNAGNQESPHTDFVRIDRTRPSISGLPTDGCNLWPPNHRLMTIATIGADDAGSGVAPSSLVISATSSEPDDALGDGNTEPDIVVEGNSVAVRAERSGTGEGRIYTVTVEVADLAGNTTTASASCVVPHDQRGAR